MLSNRITAYKMVNLFNKCRPYSDMMFAGNATGLIPPCVLNSKPNSLITKTPYCLLNFLIIFHKFFSSILLPVKSTTSDSTSFQHLFQGRIKTILLFLFFSLTSPIICLAIKISSLGKILGFDNLEAFFVYSNVICFCWTAFLIVIFPYRLLWK